MKLNKRLFNLLFGLGLLVFFVFVTFIYNQVSESFINEAIENETSKIAEQDLNTIKGKVLNISYQLDAGLLGTDKLANGNIVKYAVEIPTSELTDGYQYNLTYPISYANGFEVNDITDQEVHLYVTNEAKTKVAIITNPTLLFQDLTEGFVGFFSNDNGEIIGSSGQFPYVLLVNFLSDSSNLTVTELFTKTIDENSFTTKITLSDENYILHCDDYNNIYFISFVNTNNSAISYSTLNNFTYAYFLILLAGFVAVIFVIRFHEQKEISLAQLGDQIYSRRISSMLIRIEKNGKIIKTNNTFYSMIGIYNKEKTQNINLFESVDDKSVLEHFSKGEQIIAKVFNEKLEQDVYIRLAPIRNRNNYVIQGQNVTEEFLRNKYVEELSSINQVTRYPNKLKYLISFPNLKESINKKDVSIISINIQKFREKNKVFGRQIGDKILVEVVKLINAQFPDCNVYHFDADFFLVVAIKDNKKDVISYCQNLTETLKQPLNFSDNHIYTSVKMGIYNIPKDEIAYDAEDVLSKSNMALRKARDTYKRDYFIYDKVLAEAVKKEFDMLEDLRSAIKQKEFVMFYQPQFNIVENRITGFEALIRWPNSKYKDQSPQVFIELAEQNSMINQIGDIVIDLVFKAAETFQKYNILLSMNVSPIQILQVGFVQNLLNGYEAHHLKPGSVCIEITETFLMENFTMVLEKLNILVKHGFSIHLDDFGTGYSSMLYLADLPADTIKIDKEFTKVIDVDKASATIVARLINMAQELNKDIIVEGVETEEQLRVIKRLGANIIQGYLFGRPVDFETALEEIKSPSLMLNKRNQVIRVK